MGSTATKTRVAGERPNEGVGGGEVFQEKISEAGEMGQAGQRRVLGGGLCAGRWHSRGQEGERGGPPVDFKELRFARADLAAILVECVNGDAEAGGAGGAGLAAGGEFVGEIEKLLTGAAGAFHPDTSADGEDQWKAGVSRSDTLNF